MKHTYKLQLKVISPIYIGSGDVYSRCDYINIPDEKRVYLLDKKKWINFLVKSNLYENFIDSISQYGANFDTYKWLNLNSRALREKNLSALISSMSEAIFYVEHIKDFRNHNIHGFVKNSNREPYIPGSSIKGAVVTAILSYFLKNRSSKSGYYLREVYSMLKKDKIQNMAGEIDKSISEDVFDYLVNDELATDNEINNELSTIKGLSGISISDSEPLKKENLKLYKKKDVIIANGNVKTKKHDDRPVFRECLDCGSETTFLLTIDESKLKQDLDIKDIDDIMEALESRIELLFGDEGIISAWNQSLNYLPTGAFEKGVMQIGGGVGFHSKTIISAISNSKEEANDLTGKILDKIFKGKKHCLDKPISPRALKVVTVNAKDVFMGFCKIKEIK